MWFARPSVTRPARLATAMLPVLLVSVGMALAATNGSAGPIPSCPQFRCSASHSGTASSAISSANVAQLTPSWSLRTRDRVYGSPSSWKGTLFVPSEDGHVYAVDARTGAQRWAFRTAGGVWSTPAVAGRAVYFGSSDEHVYAVHRRTGRLLWKVRTGGDISASPAVADGVVYVGSNDHKVYALDARSGDVRWTYEAGDRVSSSPAVSDGTVFVGANDNKLHAIDAATGASRWTFEADGWIWGGGATVANGVVYFTSNGASGGNLYALRVATGELLWQSSGLNGFAAPAVVGDTVVASSYSEVRALSTADGSERWSYAAPGYVFTSPLVTNDLVLAINNSDAQAGIVGPPSIGDGSLVALSLADGSIVHEVYFPRLSYAYSSPIAVGDQVFFGAGTGVLHSLSLSGGAAGEIVAQPAPAEPLPYAHRDVLGDMLDQGSPAELRLPGDGVSKVSNSEDPQGTNNDYYHFHGRTDDGRVVLMDVRGAGVLTDLYMYYSLAPTATGPIGPPAGPPPEGGAIAPTIAMYVDGEEVFDMNAADFYRGEAGFPFVFPLVSEHSAAASSHVPVPFRERLLVVADEQTLESGFWYDFYYQQFPDARGVQSFD
ncbi:MAG: PQQ-binding-like beta-propeller repeat protein, partial [Actinomycetota bacterium]